MTHRLLLGSLLLVAQTALATPRAPRLDHRVDARIGRALALGFNGTSHLRHVGTTHVMLELTAEPDAAAFAALEALGARLTRVAGNVIHYHRFVPVEVDAVAANGLVALPAVVKMHHVGPSGPVPLERSAELIHLADARGARPMQDILTGSGVLIGDIDTMTDPFHPTFFKGDGGYFDWIDVDGDGTFTPGVDAVDIDRDGTVSLGETGQWLPAATIDAYGDKISAARIAGFDPGTDWVYLDTNGNGARDYGAAAGFDDSVPAFGEPLFVPDDLNRNGTLDVGERMVRLSTSKFRKIYVNLSNRYASEFGSKAVSDLFVRGTNLSAATPNYSDGALYGFSDAFHATGVNTILVGDVPLAGRRWVGMAPDAELVLGFEIADESYPVDATMWALGEKADVILYELSNWVGDSLDGSDALSTVIDESTVTDHVTNVCPTGDQGSAHKHDHAVVASGGVGTMSLNVPTAALGYPTTGYPMTQVQLTINIRGGTPSAAALTGPHGDVIDLLSTAHEGTIASGVAYYPTQNTTSRGTFLIDLLLYNPSGAPVDIGEWSLAITAGGHALTVDAYASDDISIFGQGAGWDDSTSTDAATVGIPSTADHCIAVNAIPGHLDEKRRQPWFDAAYFDYSVPLGYEDEPGKIRAYTPRGPRLDGVTKPDVSAPDNPWVAAQHTGGEAYDYGSFRVFSGTSGASPHVAGVAALLASVGVRGDDARDAIRNGADHDSITGAVPNGDYGYGRLNAAAALGVTSVGKDFDATLAVSGRAIPRVGDTVTLTPTAVGDADAITGIDAKWDDQYDGTWDVPYAANAPRKVRVDAPGRYAYKVRLRNAAGHVAEALVYVTFAAHQSSGCAMGAGRDASGFAFALVAGLLAVAFVRRRLAVR